MSKVSLFQALRQWGDAKEKGTGKVGGAGKFPPVLFVFALFQFSGPDYLGAWNRLVKSERTNKLAPTIQTNDSRLCGNLYSLFWKVSFTLLSFQRSRWSTLICLGRMPKYIVSLQREHQHHWDVKGWGSEHTARDTGGKKKTENLLQWRTRSSNPQLKEKL